MDDGPIPRPPSWVPLGGLNGRRPAAAGMDAVKASRFAREAVYLPKADMVLFGYLLQRDGKSVMPLYDCADNRWLTAEIPGSDFIGRKKQASSVDLGLVYDAKRDIVWGVLCKLRETGALNALRVDAGTLKAEPLKGADQ